MGEWGSIRHGAGGDATGDYGKAKKKKAYTEIAESTEFTEKRNPGRQLREEEPQDPGKKTLPGAPGANREIGVPGGVSRWSNGVVWFLIRGWMAGWLEQVGTRKEKCSPQRTQRAQSWRRRVERGTPIPR
jgi:hypothetical protein